jgi:hypothetical protein
MASLLFLVTVHNSSWVRGNTLTPTAMANECSPWNKTRRLNWEQLHKNAGLLRFTTTGSDIELSSTWLLTWYQDDMPFALQEVVKQACTGPRP